MNDTSTIIACAIAFYNSGNSEKAKNLIAQLDSTRTLYQYGAVDYALAQFYAGVEDRTSALRYFKKAVQAGALFTSRTFGNDPHFSAYQEEQDFIAITTYWNH